MLIYSESKCDWIMTLLGNALLAVGVISILRVVCYKKKKIMMKMYKFEQTVYSNQANIV